MRRSVVLFAALVTAVAIAGLAFSGDGSLTDDRRVEAQGVDRPNFIVVMSDDLDERSMERSSVAEAS